MKYRHWTVLIALWSGGCHTATTEPVVISAASSLTYALQQLTDTYRDSLRTTDDATSTDIPDLRLNFGATGALAQQIRQGAPVDLFASADRGEIETLRSQGYLTKDEILFYGQLVIWCRQDGPCAGDLTELDQPAINRIAIAHPQIATYGAAAIAAIRQMNLEQVLTPRLIQGQTARATLRYAETGDADVALTARSLAQAVGGRWYAVDSTLYPPIEQVIAITTHAPQPDAARRFFDFLRSPIARSILEEHGFRQTP